jgi:hypothetical protein
MVFLPGPTVNDARANLSALFTGRTAQWGDRLSPSSTEARDPSQAHAT